MHGERFGVRLSARWRSLAVGTLVLALAAGTMSAEAASPSPSPKTSASGGATPSPPASPVPSVKPAPPVPPKPTGRSSKAAAAGEPTTSNAVYAYDAVGRLVGVTDPAGETARYRFDAAGNRLGVDRFASSELSVLSVVPVRAAAGAKVTLSGTGFSATAASNAVSFGGVAGEVVSASATRLVVTVPAGAAHGKVSVVVGGKSVESLEAFTPASSGPSISKIEPSSGQAGTEVKVTGSGFAAAATDNVVRFGGGIVAEVVGRTDTALTVKVPAGAVTGPVEVETPDGLAAAAAQFRVQSGGAGEIESSATTSATDETPPTLSVTTPGNRAQVLFDAEQGEDIGLGFTGKTFNQSVTAKLYDPQGGQVGSGRSFSGAEADWEIRDLPLAGRYSLIIDPGPNNIGAVTVTLSRPQASVLDLAGPTAEVQLTRAGQDAQLTFPGVQGQSLSLGVDTAGMTKATYARLYGPGGDEVDNVFVSAKRKGSLDVDALPASGQYTVIIDPENGGTGALKVTGSRYADAGGLDPTGPAVELAIARPGQNGIARFSAEAGQRVSLGATSTGLGTSTEVEIRRPNGTRLDYFTMSDRAPEDWDSEPLPEPGTYTIVVEPNELGTGTLALTLSRPVGGVQLSTTGPSVKAAISRSGQNAEWSFRAAAGDFLSLGLTGNTFSSTVHVSVIAPSGAKVVDERYVSAGAAGTIGLPDLGETGSYLVIVDPNEGKTGTLALTLSADVLAPVSADGAEVPVSVGRAGQRVRARFTAADTVSLGIAVTANTMPQATDIRLVGPGGGVGTYVGNVSKNSAEAKYLNGLTPGTTYTLLFEPDKAATGGMTLWLSKPVLAGALSVSAPTAQGQITRPGQQLEFTVNASAGEGVAVDFTGTTLAGLSRLFHRAPGAAGEEQIDTLSSQALDADLRAPLAAGSHRLSIRPMDATTGRTNASLVPDIAGGNLEVGGAQRAATIITAGQNAHYTFTGTKGQKLTVGLKTPPYDWSMSVFGPDGKWLVDSRYMTSTKLADVLPVLPAAGVYTLVVNPQSRRTGTYTLGVSATAAAATTVSSPHPQTAENAPAAKAPVGVVPSGADAWQPGKVNLSGQDWITARGRAPKAPAQLRAPPGTTALTGRVLKLDGKPLPKVTVRVGKKSARTDAQGRFLLPGISADATTLVVDGASANTKQRQYGRFDIRITPKAGTSVDVGFPVWMTPLDTRHTVKFAAPAKTEVVLKTPRIPGLEVRIPKGSVVRDEQGKPVTELGITAIPIDRPPFPLPKNSVVPVYFTVQPGGTYVFPKGAQVIYPNYTREAPGTRVEFMDYDPKKKGWYVYGYGKVSADGRQVVPDAKTRVWAFHGAMFNVSDLVPWDVPWLKDTLDWLSGDPVELGTGLLTDSRTDLAVADARGSAEVTRTYWQGDTRTRAFGTGRDLSYNAFLHSEQQYKEVDLYLPGGAKLHYVRTSPGTSFNDAVFEPLDTPSEFHGSKIVNGDGEWELRFRDGTVWIFPQYAALKEIRDRHGNTVKLTRLNGKKGEITRITTPGGRWISLAYDAQHRVREARDNTGRTTTYTYDNAGRLETVTDPAGKVSRYTYDGTTHRIKTAVDARGITYMTNTFDTDGRVREQTLTVGAKYTFGYTKNGAGKITASEVTEPGGAVRRVEFDAGGYGVSDTRAYGSPLARKTIYQRGAYHRIDAVTDPYGRRTELTYDTNGNITATQELAGTANARSSGTVTYDGPFDQPTKATDPLGNSTTFGYDPSGNLHTVTDPEGRTTRLSHTADGQIKTVTDASGAVSEYIYRHGERASARDAEGRTSGQFRDAAGRLTVLTDPAGSVTTIAYDKLNQTRRTLDPLGQSISFDYDDNGNLTTLTDARSNTTTWAYDQADRPRTATDPLGAQASFAYDAAGRITQAISRSGHAATAEYDLLGRPKNAKHGVNTLGQAESMATYAYDGVDLLAKITDTQAGTQAFTYDVFDRIRSTTGPTGTVGYDYDNLDRRKVMTAAGVTTAYGYDKSSTLTSVSAGPDTVTFGLDQVGREKTATLPGGFTRTTGYDKTGTLTSIAYTRGAGTVGDLTYSRDIRGLQTSLTGSLANVALPAAESGATFDKDNRLTQLGGRSFTYDSDGRLKTDGIRDYTWNARGQLTGLTEAGRPSSFTYDPFGGRSGKTIGGTANRFLTDGSNPLVEQNGHGETTATVTTSGLDRFLTRTEAGKTQIYLTDALGTVVGLADADGSIATRYAYDPNGRATASGATSSNPYTFTGREDDGTGLLYYRNRYYDPATGRFISQDPIGHAGGPNLYQYALSSPTTYTDPSGNSPLIAGCLAGGLTDGLIDWGFQRLSGRKVNWGQVGSAAAMGCAFGMVGAGIGAKLGAGGMCKSPNSFTGDTPVMMADGTRKPIKDVNVGDKVVAADPETGESGPREVTALIKGSGDKQLVDITIKPGGPETTATERLTATNGHPFWVPSLRKWVDAGELQPTQWLRTSAGTWVQITAVQQRTESTTVYNLTVADLHTYYVLAGATPVLVHNCGVTNAARAEADIASSVRPSKARPAVAEALQLPSGQVYSSPSVRGTPPTLHPIVQDILDAIPVAERGVGHGSCGLAVCVSRALTDGHNPTGSSAAGVIVRGSRDNPMHGYPVGPCGSCVALEDAFDLVFVTAR